MWKLAILAVMMGLLLIGCTVSAQGKPTKEPKPDDRLADLEERVATLEAFHVPTPTPTPGPPPPDDPLSWWPGEGNANDIADGNSGILNGDTTFASGKVGQAFSFDGSGDYVDMGDVLDGGTSSFSISLWYQRQAADGENRRVVSKGLTANGTPPDAGYAITIIGGSVRVTVEDANQNKVDIGVTEPTLGQFHHAAAVVDRSGALVKLYVNGVIAVNADISSVGSLDTDQAFGIGASIINGSPTGSFDGLIDEIQFYDRALSADEVEAIFNAAGP